MIARSGYQNNREDYLNTSDNISYRDFINKDLYHFSKRVIIFDSIA